MSSGPTDGFRGSRTRTARTILDRTDEAIVTVDTDRVVTVVNDRFEDLVGRTDDDLVGRSLGEVVPDAVDDTIEEGRRRATREREPATFEEYCEELDRWFVVRVFPDDSGLSVHLRDVTDHKERERELERKERALDAAPVGITVSDPDRDDNPLIYVNRGFERLTGYSSSEILGRNCRFLQGEETDPEAVERLRRAIDAEEPVREEIRNYREDGTPFWNRVTITPVHDEDGTVLNYIGVQEDVTERKRLSRRLHESESSLRELYDITSDVDMSFEEKVRRILAIGRDRLGLRYAFLTRMEDGTQHVVESRGSHDLLQPGESCPLSEAYCRKTIESEGLLGVRDVASEGWNDDPAYERFDLGCYLGGKVVVDDDLYGTLCFADDDARTAAFTDAERTFVELLVKWIGYELTLRQNERRLRRLQRTANELMLATTEDEVARIAVDTVRSVLDHPITGMWRYDDANRRLEPIAETDEARSIVGPAPTFEEGEGLVWRAFENGDLRTYDDVRYRSDVYNPDTPVRSEVIVPLGRYGVISTGSTETGTFTDADVTLLRLLAATVQAAFVRVERERLLRETRERLEHKNEALAVLNRIIRHDIGNEITAVLGWGDVLEDRVDPRNEEYVRRVLTAAEHITRITDTVGDFLEVVEEAEGPATDTQDLVEMLTTQVDQAASVHDTAEFTLDGDLPDSLPVEASHLLSSVFRNLLENAVTHNDEETPEVTVDVETTETSVVVSVADNGPGIPDDRKPELFDRKADGSRRDTSGVGLYLADFLVDLHGGDIWVEDNDPKGSVFGVELPKSDDEGGLE